jgi:hypothetical protein
MGDLSAPGHIVLSCIYANTIPCDSGISLLIEWFIFCPRRSLDSNRNPAARNVPENVMVIPPHKSVVILRLKLVPPHATLKVLPGLRVRAHVSTINAASVRHMQLPDQLALRILNQKETKESQYILL